MTLTKKIFIMAVTTGTKVYIENKWLFFKYIEGAYCVSFHYLPTIMVEWSSPAVFTGRLLPRNAKVFLPFYYELWLGFMRELWWGDKVGCDCQTDRVQTDYRGTILLSWLLILLWKIDTSLFADTICLCATSRLEDLCCKVFLWLRSTFKIFYDYVTEWSFQWRNYFVSHG